MQNNNYMCLTAHWIDDDWILQKRILNFCEIKDHRGESIAKQIEDCLFQWGIEKVFTITVDNASANDSAITILKKRFKSWDGFAMVYDGEFLQMRCAAHILNLVVSEGLKEMNKSIELIRHAVKYVKSSPSRKRRFIMLAERERVESKSLLTLDCPTRWNSTYLMLESAVKFVKVFTRMEEEDEEYKQYFKKKVKKATSRDSFILIDDREGVDDEFDDITSRRIVESTILPPSAYDWSAANEFLGFLKLFYNMTLKFSGSNYVTSNTCFQHIVSIQTSLESNASSSYSILNDMSRRMLSKFNKYWGAAEKMNPLLVVAVILDPRYKLTYVKVAFADIFHEPTQCEAMLRKITSLLYRLYDHYLATIHVGESSSQPTSEQGDNVELELEGDNVGDATYQKFLAQADAENNVEKISEVDEYLRAELVGYRDSKFDLLAWWKVNACKYKVLSLIARDMLAVPVSTVSSESAFSTGGRVLDAFRSSLSSKMAEALICAQNWLSVKPPNFNDFDCDNFDETEAIVIEADAAVGDESEA
ncbi:hypothetical protein QN277_014874 [Acacia crassicarpa]|uniref:Transposase n=1 Tax=Acacia crassicarpa TaxID=499986 RepID=A0AAE1JZB7_9FABA|nr:hypothetical protein QN277_014874 [Acacia crassicarpa]